ncbi:MAG TPA: signal recognition particle-docking protein FtsY, partial [Oligoflexia bacterium]|nr:signal recognition particle-docking protein FtsY [Oligoflexia bacterium]
KVDGKPKVVLVAGVNGVGKTTTIGKLAHQFRSRGARVLLAACDTFRAAADEQLDIWAKRAGVEVVSGASGTKPATVAFQAVHRAVEESYDVLLVDTAGRLHTRVNLMNELVHVVQILGRELPGAPHETILVLDGSTGQNALQQARTFHERIKLTGIIVTKLDGTAKGGVIVPIKEELSVPIRYIGVGESITALRPFSAQDFTAALFAEE